MTRINVVPVTELHYKHLIAEYRELPRVFALVRKACAKGLSTTELGIPKEYVLGKGHVLFFYDKCMFLYKRQQQLVSEMLHRGYNPTFLPTEDLIADLPVRWLGDYTPTDKAIQINRVRIQERMPTV